jgi:HSP20 family protein
MAIRDLVPWNSRGREIIGRRDEEPHPILSLHREMNRLFEDVFRGFDLSPFSMDRWNGTNSWPRIEISESEKEVQVTAELPGLEEKDIEVEQTACLLSEARRKPRRRIRIASSANAIMAGLSGVFRWTTSIRTRSMRRSRTGS